MLMFRGQKVWYVVAGVLVLVTVLAVAFVVWRPFTKQSPSLLPASILQQITGFTPYFYTDQIPAGYAFDSSKIVFDGRVLLYRTKTTTAQYQTGLLFLCNQDPDHGR
jgi:hypothetical protein